MRPASKIYGETRPVWKEYQQAVRETFGWIKATGWKPDVPLGSQPPKEKK